MKKLVEFKPSQYNGYSSNMVLVQLNLKVKLTRNKSETRLFSQEGFQSVRSLCMKNIGNL